MRPALQRIVEEFGDADREDRLELLLEYANALPPLPARLRDAGRLEQVHECQTPLFVAAEVDDGRVALFFDAPGEAPTTRGFAGVLHAGLDGGTVEEVLATPSDFFVGMHLQDVVSPLRMRGMGAILAHVKRRLVVG